MKYIVVVLTLSLYVSTAFAQVEEKTETKAESQAEAEAEPAKPEPPAKQAVPVHDSRPNKSWNVHADVLLGSYESMGNASLTFANAGQYPTLTSGEKIPTNLKSVTTGFQIGGGYRWSKWLSWNMNILVLAAKQDTKITTSTGATHDVKLETGFLYFSPATWTGYPVEWLYLQAGIGLLAEAHRVTTDINNIGNFDTGSFGSGIHLGAGVEFPLSKMFSLRGGLTLISAATVSQEKKINEGQASEVTAKWEERKIGIGLLSFGTKIYF